MPAPFPNSIKAHRATNHLKIKAHKLPILLYLPKIQLHPLRQLTVLAPQQETTILPEIV
ncbi:hypothetical protein E5S67_04780 [Microcoleus sp. IPMA8]|uniref:Uncharacterized protein n=1 Tax=Microcoleus asticus IPMA8 TaxID=2563858 RepID=A0ABX2D3F2_9CYAN|nr:hypothetical protein [Microcoleus asticus]NQE37013.1 hypothetical protein [Microcoleus asticus IPMA8]